MTPLPETSCLTIEEAGHGVTVTVDVPGDELNLVGSRLHDELVETMSYLRRTSGARVVLLTGRGRAFSGGGDIRSLMPKLQDPSYREQIHQHTRQLLTDVLDLPMPVVVGLNGDAIGLAASLVLLSDIVVMSSEASLADPHVRVGLTAGDGGAVAWPNLVGHIRAKRYLLTGDPVPAVEAERIGLVTDVVEPDDVLPCATRWAQRLARGAPLAISYTKRAVNAQLRAAVLTSLETSTALEMLTATSADHAEAISAVRERRRPEFTGR